MRSPCVEGRKRHRFRGVKTHGPLTLRDHANYKCWWCGKTYGQVKREQKLARRRKKK